MSVVISKCKLWPPLPHRPGPHKLCPHTSFYYGHRATIIVPSASIFPRLMNDRREVFSNLFMVCIGVGEGVGQVWELIRGLASAPGFQQNVICYKFSPRSIVFFLLRILQSGLGQERPVPSLRGALSASSGLTVVWSHALWLAYLTLISTFDKYFWILCYLLIKAYTKQCIRTFRNIRMTVKIRIQSKTKLQV